MLPRFHWSDITIVGHYLGVLVLLTGALMFIPLLVALAFGEYACAVDFVFGIGCCLLLGSLLRLLKGGHLDRRRSLLLTGFSWIIIGLMCAIPLYTSGEYGSFLDALFDSVSSITTTGASLASNLDKIPYAQIVWHALMTFCGGQAIVIIALFMGFLGEGSVISNGTAQGYGDLLASDFREATRYVWIFAVILVIVGTVVAFAIGLGMGLAPSDALVNGFCLVANATHTGGFVPHSSSLVFYHSPALDACALVFMLLGATNYGIYFLAMKRKYRSIAHNAEVRAFGVWLIVLVICVTYGLTRDGVYTTVGGLLDRGLFTILASAFTGGMQTIYPTQLTTCLSDGVLFMLIAAAFFGAMSCSTAGGVKFYRVMQIVRWFGYSIVQTLLPDRAHHSVRYEYFGKKRLNSTDVMHAMTITILFLGIAMLGALAFIAHGNDALVSVMESVSFVCNNGITTGITTPNMGVDLKVIAILQMWAGRLEFIALIAAIVGLLVSPRPLRRARKVSLGTQRNRERFRRSRTRGEKGTSKPLLLVIVLCACLAVSSMAQTSTARAAEQGNAVMMPATVYHKATITSLLSFTNREDGEQIQFSGEAIGSPITADADHVWVNLKSGYDTIGVYMTNAEAAQITTYGSYRATGDTVKVQGVFHLACSDHTGELDVHADRIHIGQAGSSTEHPVELGLLYGGLTMGILGCAILVFRRILRGKSRRRLFLFG